MQPEENPASQEHPDEHSEQDAQQRRIASLARLAQTTPPNESRSGRPVPRNRQAAILITAPTRTRMLLRRLLLPGLLALAVVAFLALPAGFPLHPWLSRVAPQPAATATPALPLSARQVYLEPDVPGMLVSLDGHEKRFQRSVAPPLWPSRRDSIT